MDSPSSVPLHSHIGKTWESARVGAGIAVTIAGHHRESWSQCHCPRHSLLERKSSILPTPPHPHAPCFSLTPRAFGLRCLDDGIGGGAGPGWKAAIVSPPPRFLPGSSTSCVPHQVPALPLTLPWAGTDPGDTCTCGPARLLEARPGGTLLGAGTETPSFVQRP